MTQLPTSRDPEGSSRSSTEKGPSSSSSPGPEPPAGSTHEGIADELIASRGGQASVSRYRDLDEAAQFDVLRRLKTRVDGLVRSRPEEAVAVAGVMMRAATKAVLQQALAFRARGVTAYFAGRTEDAREAFYEAARRYLEAGEELDTAQVRRSLVEIELSLGNFPKALLLADLAHGVFEDAGREDLLAGLEINVGNIHFRRDDHAPARKSYASARRRAQRTGDENRLALAEFGLANVELAAGRLEKAERSFARARDVFGRRGAIAHVADCDYSLAYLESRRSRFGEALRGLEAARRRYLEGSKPSGAAYVDLDAADVLFRLHAWRDSRRLARRASHGFERFGFRSERAKADALASLALLRLGEHDKAREELDSALEAFRRLGNRTQVSFLEIQRCILAVAAGRVEEVLPTLRRIHGELARSGQRLLQELAALALAEALTVSGDPASSLEVLEALAPSEKRTGVSGLTRADVHRARAAAHLALGRGDQAIRSLERSVDEIESSYSRVPGRDLRVAFLRERREAFCDLAWLLLQRGDTESTRRALSLVERSRLRSLTELAPRQELPAEVERARQQLDAYLVQRLDAEIGSWSGASESSKPPSDAVIRAAEDELMRALRGTPGLEQASSVHWSDELMTRVTGDNEVLVNYFVTRGGACAFLVDREGLEAVTLPWNEAELSDLRDRLAFQVHCLRSGGELAGRHARRVHRTCDDILDGLGEALIAPLSARVGDRALVVVPYGPLHGMPFHAFRLHGRYLIQDRDVGYALGMSLLARSRAERTPGRGGIAVTTCSDPTLPSAGQEVQGIRDLYGEDCELVEAVRFRDVLEDLGERFRAVHVTAHGSFEPGHPLFSGMRIGDGFVTAYDLRTMRLPFDFVTLSGCETGRLLQVAGEDLCGLQHALFLAGARNVVSSLWPVVDREALRVMQSFYAHLAEGSPVRGALADAQRELIEEGWAPLSWAAYVTTGSPDVRLPRTPEPTPARPG